LRAFKNIFIADLARIPVRQPPAPRSKQDYSLKVSLLTGQFKSYSKTDEICIM